MPSLNHWRLCFKVAVRFCNTTLGALNSSSTLKQSRSRVLYLKYSTLSRRSALMSQFDRIKKQYQDYILLFQVGDFYEIYGDDANLVSGRTSMRLTKKSDIFMCGFPVKSLSEWQKTLVHAGFQLAICDQNPPTRKKKGHLLERDVVKLITPGTLVEPLHNEANYLLSIATCPSNVVGLAWTDISTSELKVSSSEVELVDNDLERIAPAEVLLPDFIVEAVHEGRGFLPSHPDHVSVTGLLKSSLLKECHLTGVPHSWYSESKETGKDKESKIIREFTNNVSKGQFSQLEQAAVRGLLRFIEYTQQEVLPHLSAPTLFSQDQHMTINSSTRRALELVIPLHSNTRKATLLGSIDRTVTASGGRLLKTRLSSPITDREAIIKRLESVEVFHDDIFHSEVVANMLKNCADLERIVQKVATASCNITDLQAIKNTLQTSGDILEYIQSNFPRKERLKDELDGLHNFPELVSVLEDAISGEKHGSYIAKGYSNELDTLRTKMDKNLAKMNVLEEKLRKELSLPLVIIPHKKFFRVLEVTKTHTARAEKSSALVRIDSTQSKTRFSHTELQKLNAELASLETAYSAMQDALFRDLCNKIMARVEDIMKTAQALARIDVALSLGLLAVERGYCKPVMRDGSEYRVVGGLHPVVASQRLSTFVRNNCTLEGEHLWIVTGPNMGGKSTFLRQNALISILAQMGSFVPAESATLGVVDRLFARVGASDNVSKHMSTFHLEMSETAHVLANATHRSLIILDEVGRGTAYREGLAIAQAVVEFIHKKIGCRALVATHYHQLALLTERLPGIACYKLTADRDEEGVIFTYQIQPGYINHSFALDVARLSGLPAEVIERAKSLHDHLNESRECTEQSGGQRRDDPPVDSCRSMSLTHQQMEVLNRLEGLSLDNTTPLDALNFLHNLKKNM